MKITVEVSNTEIAAALLQYALANHDYLKAAVKAYALASGSEINDASVYALNADNSISIVTTVGAVAVLPPAKPIVSPAPPLVPTPVLPVGIPVTPVPSPGHMVQVDPPFSATVWATEFGYRDPTDNGEGFFTNPATGKPYLTNNLVLRGVSLPREVMLSTFLAIDSWKTEGIDSVWSRNADLLRQWVLGNQPLITIDSGGKSCLDLVICDAGPSAGTGNGIDLTGKIAQELNTKDKALATYMIRLKGVPMTIRGWDFKANKVG